MRSDGARAGRNQLRIEQGLDAVAAWQDEHGTLTDDERVSAEALLDERIARASGARCGRARSDDVVDASIVVLARMLDASVVTGDADDLRRLADAAGYSISLHQI